MTAEKAKAVQRVVFAGAQMLSRPEGSEILHNSDKLREVNRLGYVQLKAGTKGAGPILASSQSGQRHGRHGTAAGQSAQSGNELVAVVAGHADITQDHVGRELREILERLFH
jgi:hypothetical protein